MSDELKPCPFCSKPAYAPVHSVTCCTDESGCPAAREAVSVELWNRRAIDEAWVERVASLLIDWDRTCTLPFDERARAIAEAYLGRKP